MQKYSTKDKQKLGPIRVGQRVVGLECENTFEEKVHDSHYFLRNPRAISLALSSLAEAVQIGAQWVQVRDTDCGFIYRAAIEYFLRVGFDLNREHGLQIAFCLEKWNLTRLSGDLAEQLSLLGD